MKYLLILVMVVLIGCASTQPVQAPIEPLNPPETLYLPFGGIDIIFVGQGIPFCIGVQAGTFNKDSRITVKTFDEVMQYIEERGWYYNIEFAQGKP